MNATFAQVVSSAQSDFLSLNLVINSSLYFLKIIVDLNCCAHFFLSFHFSFFFWCVCLFRAHLRHMKVPRLGVKLEL